MMRQRFLSFGLAVTFAGLALAGRSVHAEGWGNLKGRVVWAGAPYKPAAIKAVENHQDRAHCLSKGPLPDQKYVVNPKNNGVRWVMVWLVDSTSPTKKLP